METEIKQVWKDLKNLDSQIRTIEKAQSEDKSFYWVVKIGLFESLGETGGDILTEIFYNEPTEDQIKEKIKYHIEDLKQNLNGGFTTAREDEQIKVLNNL
jgi:hypothetical protein